ncbi:hypothetical protein [Arthrobacter sp. H20]|uniref:hypothetical protein n=1 Tax=Arthrobacter sp. H20 TaxID=1267981 RepID=UPI0004AF693A|nr:hypothetical protein [Arthrobacter sp. H20]
MTAAGDLLPVYPPPDAAGISVHGGVGSIKFQWEELREGALRLGQLADDVRDILHLCGDLQWRLQMLLTGQDMGAHGAGAVAVYALDDARAALARRDDELHETAQRIEACRLAYAAAEAVAQVAIFAAQAGVTEVERGLGRVIGLANAANLAEPTPLTVERVSPAAPLTIDGSVPALLERIEAVNDEGPGVFEVLKVRGSGGPVFVVVLPGTQGSSIIASSNPFDPTGVVEAVQYDSVFVTEAVRGALVESGASEGDRVMVVGYSQGGMHAANIAQHPDMIEDYQLDLVLTAGSPTGAGPSGAASYLHLEHADDWVHKVDGMPNPDERGRVTATLRGPVVEITDGGTGLGAAHKLGTYLRGAEAVESSSHPSILASVGGLRSAIGTRAPAERHVFRARRRSIGEPDSSASDPRGRAPDSRTGAASQTDR